MRFIVDGLIRTQLGRRFPWGTLIINITGSLLLGVIIGLALNGHLSPSIKLILGTGFCGGYTTFSTVSFEAVRLIEDKHLSAGLGLMAGTLSLTIASAAAGIWLTQL